MRGKNRSRSTISQLPPEVRDVVDEMVKATNTCTLADIQKYLASLDVTLSLQAISTYSRKLLASLEENLLAEINALGIGPQGLGGSCTALGCAVEGYPCHIASLPLGVSLNCHVARHQTITL